MAGVKRPRLGAAMATAAVGLALTGCTGGGGAGIEIGTVVTATVTEVVEAPANVQARATTTLTATGDGTLAALYVKDGQRVPPGALGSLAAAQRGQAEAAVTAAQKSVDALTLRAPIGGVVQLGGAGSTSAGSTAAGSLSSVLDQLPADVRDQASAALGGSATGSAP